MLLAPTYPPIQLGPDTLIVPFIDILSYEAVEPKTPVKPPALPLEEVTFTSCTNEFLTLLLINPASPPTYSLPLILIFPEVYEEAIVLVASPVIAPTYLFPLTLTFPLT